MNLHHLTWKKFCRSTSASLATLDKFWALRPNRRAVDRGESESICKKNVELFIVDLLL